MQLTDAQLNAAARKLCELWNLSFDDASNMRLVVDCLRNLTENYDRELSAILHAVTSEQKDEVSE